VSGGLSTSGVRAFVSPPGHRQPLDPAAGTGKLCRAVGEDALSGRWGSIVLLVWAGSISTAEAACVTQRLPWSYGSSTSGTWRTTVGEPCSIGNNNPQHVESMTIARRPRNGIAGQAHPTGWAYQPRPGFKGTDSFTVRIVSNASHPRGRGLVATVHITVIVE
jgi:hypothetical protein